MGADKKKNAFFGLAEDCSEKELDNAYRKFARSMHPDKNGGTEEAKEKFQQMKERYGSLKSKRGEAEDTSPKEGQPDEGQDTAEADDSPAGGGEEPKQKQRDGGNANREKRSPDE